MLQPIRLPQTREVARPSGRDGDDHQRNVGFPSPSLADARQPPRLRGPRVVDVQFESCFCRFGTKPLTDPPDILIMGADTAKPYFKKE